MLHALLCSACQQSVPSPFFLYSYSYSYSYSTLPTTIFLILLSPCPLLLLLLLIVTTHLRLQRVNSSTKRLQCLMCPLQEMLHRCPGDSQKTGLGASVRRETRYLAAEIGKECYSREGRAMGRSQNRSEWLSVRTETCVRETYM